MKHNKAPEPHQDASLSYIPDWNNGKTFTINSDYEDVLAVQQVIDTKPADIPVAVQKPVTAAQEAPQQPEVLEGRKASIMAKLYDIRNGRNMYQLLKEQREAERDLAMARRLGLITTDRCAKHERQLAKIRGIV